MSRRRVTQARSGTLALVAALLLTGCFTGKRPSFSDDPYPPGAPTGDAAIDALLTKLDAGAAGYTATYDVLRKFGEITSTASVSVDGVRRSVTVRTVRYLTDANGSTRTCQTSEGAASCTDGVNAAPISDTGLLTPDFSQGDAARRIRRDASAALAPTVSRTAQFAGLDATCVDITLSGGTASYCVLDNGVLANVDDGDVRITVSSLLDAVDENAFTDVVG